MGQNPSHPGQRVEAPIGSCHNVPNKILGRADPGTGRHRDTEVGEKVVWDNGKCEDRLSLVLGDKKVCEPRFTDVEGEFRHHIVEGVGTIWSSLMLDVIDVESVDQDFAI